MSTQLIQLTLRAFQEIDQLPTVQDNWLLANWFILARFASHSGILRIAAELARVDSSSRLVIACSFQNSLTSLRTVSSVVYNRGWTIGAMIVCLLGVHLVQSFACGAGGYRGFPARLFACGVQPAACCPRSLQHGISRSLACSLEVFVGRTRLVDLQWQWASRRLRGIGATKAPDFPQRQRYTVLGNLAKRQGGKPPFHDLYWLAPLTLYWVSRTDTHSCRTFKNPKNSLQYHLGN